MSSDSEDQRIEDSDQEQQQDEGEYDQDSDDDEVQSQGAKKKPTNVGSDEEDEEDDEDEQKRLEQEEKLIREQLKHASFETIMKIKAQQKALEMQKQQLKSQRKSKSADGKGTKGKPQEKIEDKRANKGAPLERSAKKPVSVFKTVISSKKQKGRDPRFDGLSGQLDTTMFNNSYAFIDDMKKKEIEILSKDVKKNKYSNQEKLVLKKELGKIKSEVKQKEYNDRKQSVADKYKKQVKEQISKGQMPYFAKQNQIKDDILKLQYDKLENDGKLERLLKKKRKQQSDKLMSAYHLIAHKKNKKE